MVLPDWVHTPGMSQALKTHEEALLSPVRGIRLWTVDSEIVVEIAKLNVSQCYP